MSLVPEYSSVIESLRNVIFEYANVIVIIPLGLALQKRKANNRALKAILLFLVVSAITQIISYTLWKFNKNNLPLLHVYTLLEYWILLWFYSFLLGDLIKKNVFIGLLVVFTLFSFVDALFLDGLFAFNIYSRSIEALIIITLSISWFIKIVGLDEEQKLPFSGLSYMISGLLIYFSGSILLFSYSSYIKEMAVDSRMNLWVIHTFLAVQLYIFISIGLWKAKAR